MTPKEYLSNIGRLNHEVEQLREEMERVRTIAESITASTGNGAGGGGYSDKVGKAAVRLVDLRNRYDERVAALMQQWTETLAVVDAIEDSRQRELLHRRYFMHQSWRKIAREMFMDVSTAVRIHGRALQSFKAHWEVAHKCASDE